MTTSGFDPALVPAEVSVDDAMIRVRFASGLELATPVSRFPRLQKASPEKRKAWRLIGRGDGIHWPDVDEDISVRGLFPGAQPARSSESFNNAWDAIRDTPEEAANLTARSDLTVQIEKIVKAEGWTLKEAAERCGVSQPRMNELLRGRIENFSLDALVNMAAALGRKVRVEIEAA